MRSIERDLIPILHPITLELRMKTLGKYLFKIQYALSEERELHIRRALQVATITERELAISPQIPELTERAQEEIMVQIRRYIDALHGEDLGVARTAVDTIDTIVSLV